MVRKENEKSLQASKRGLKQIKEKAKAKGWGLDSVTPSKEASKSSDENNDWDRTWKKSEGVDEKTLPFAYGCSHTVWQRFLKGSPINPKGFKAFCKALGCDPDEVVAHDPLKDWGEAPNVINFHGRKGELKKLKQLIIEEERRAINIFGLGGIGKTNLSLKLAREVKENFEYLIWRRLYNPRPLKNLLREFIEFVSKDEEIKLATTTNGLITQLLDFLKQRRCLLILDNVESILQSQNGVESYRSGYEEYKNFFQRIGTSEHQSCLLLTSQVKLEDIKQMQGVHPVEILELKGLEPKAGQAIFQDIADNFQGTKEDWSRSIAQYGGHPLILEMAARYINTEYDGNLAKFLKDNYFLFDTVGNYLDSYLNWYFELWSLREKNVLYWLALNREPVSITELKEDLFLPEERRRIHATLDGIKKLIPIEEIAKRFTLQPILIEYLCEKAIAEVCQELESGKIQILNSHALIKASAQDYVKDSQIRLILQPIIAHWREILAPRLQNSLERRLSELLKKDYVRDTSGYTVGNLFNLMRYGDIDSERYDFSGLTLRQADLQSPLRGNFTGCEFINCSFTLNIGGVHAIAFSPARDLFAVGDTAGRIWLFKFNDDYQHYQPYLNLEGHGKNLLMVTDLTFSPDGKFLASSSIDGTVKIWYTDTGNFFKLFPGVEQWIWSVAFSHDGKTVAIGGDDGTIILWNIDTDDNRVLETYDDSLIWSLKFHPHENILAIAPQNKQGCSIHLWDTDKEEYLRSLTGHTNMVSGIDFHPDGETLASSSFDRTVKTWNIKTGNCRKTFEGHTKAVRCVAFNHDGTILASGSADGIVKTWNTNTGKCLDTLRGHRESITTLYFARDKNVLATGDNNQVLKLWNVDEGKGRCLKTWQGYTNFILTTAISPDGKLLASSGADKIVRIWDLKSNEEIATIGEHDGWVWMVDFSPDGQTLVSCSGDKTIKLWDVNTGSCRETIPTNNIIWTVKFSPDGRLLASSDERGAVCFWDSSTGDKLGFEQAHNYWIWGLTFSPDGKLLATGSLDRTIKIWNYKTKECIRTLEASNKVMTVAFHPNSQMLAAGDGKAIKLWDLKLETDEPIQTFEGHNGTVLSLVFDSKRNTIISGGIDSIIKIWSVDTAECIGFLKGHESSVRTLALTPDGQTLVSGSTDGTIRLWDLETRQCSRVLKPERPYERMNITDIRGLTDAEIKILRSLGAEE